MKQHLITNEIHDRFIEEKVIIIRDQACSVWVNLLLMMTDSLPEYKLKPQPLDFM